MPWDFRKFVDAKTGLNEFVTVSQKPEKLTKEQFTKALEAINIHIVPRQMELINVLKIPKKDNRVEEMFHGLRNRKFNYH